MGWLTLIGAGVSALGQISQGQSDKRDAYNQAILTEGEAKLQENIGKAEAAKVRKMTRAQVGQASATAAASGVQVGSGSMADLEREIQQAGAQDEFNILVNGDLQSSQLKLQAEQMRKSGRAAAASGNSRALSSALAGASDYAGGRWKRSSKATIGGTVSTTSSGVGAG